MCDRYSITTPTEAMRRIFRFAGRFRMLDISALAEGFGPRAQIDRLNPLLHCKSCGASANLVGYSIGQRSLGRDRITEARA